MKSFLKMTLLSSAIVLALAGCDDKQTTPAQEQSSNQSKSITINTESESYVVGVSYGDFLKKNIEQYKMGLNVDDIAEGFKAALTNSSKYSTEEVNHILQSLDQRLKKEAQEQLELREKEKAENKAAGDKFRKEFAQEEGVKQTESGLLYQVIEKGSERHPAANDTVVAHYKGTLIDGTQFDNSYDRGQAATFPLQNVIKGWQESLPLIGVGGKIKVVIPPELAYEDGNANIPAGSTLVFEIELLGIADQKQSNHSLGINNETGKK